MLSEGLARRVPVRLVRRVEGRVLLQGELKEGALVVLEGVQRLRDGCSVRILDGPGPAPLT